MKTTRRKSDTCSCSTGSSSPEPPSAISAAFTSWRSRTPRTLALITILSQILASFALAAGAADDIHHNLPDNLEIIDPKTLGLSGADLENFLGNVKLLPIDTFGGNGGPKAQILTVGFDGNEQLNLEDFAQLSSEGLADSDKSVAEMAFKKFKDFFKNPNGAQNFDDVLKQQQEQPEQEYRQPQATQQKQQQPSAPPPTYASPFSNPTQQSYESSPLPSPGPHLQQVQEDNYDQDHSPRTRPKKKRVRVNKRPVLFSSTFKSNNLDDEEYINEPQEQHQHSTARPEQFQDYVRAIQELQTKPPPISYLRNEFRNQVAQQYSNNTHNEAQRQKYHQNHNYNAEPQQLLEQPPSFGSSYEPKPDFEPPKPTNAVQHQQPPLPHFDQPRPVPPQQHHQQQSQTLVPQQAHFNQATFSFPSPYFVAPSAPAPSSLPPQHQPRPQHFPVPAPVQHPRQLHQPTPALPPVPVTSTSVHIQHHYDPVPTQGNYQQQSNNYVQQAQAYFPVASPTTSSHSLPTSIAPPPPPPQAPAQPQHYQQQQPQYVDYRTPSQNFVQPTVVREQIHFPSASSGPGPQAQSVFDFSNHQHNRFRVPQQQQQPQYSNHGNNGQQQNYNSNQKVQQHQAPLPPPPPPPPPPQSQPTTTPRSYSPQGIFQVTPSVPMVPIATHENAMAAYRGHAERMKSFEMSGKQPYYNKNGGQNHGNQNIVSSTVQKPPPISIPSHPPQQQQYQQQQYPQQQQPHLNHQQQQQPNNNFQPPPQRYNNGPANYFPNEHQSQGHGQQQNQHQNNFPRPPPPHSQTSSPSGQGSAFGGHLRLESQESKQRVPSPHHFHSGSGPSNYRHGPVPQPPDSVHHTRQQSTLGNLLAPMAQRIQALASRFMQAATTSVAPPPKHTMRQPPVVNFRGLPAFQDHQRHQRPPPPPPSGSGSGEKGFKFQTAPSSYHPIQFQKQFAHVNFRQNPIPPSLPVSGPLSSPSQSQYNINTKPYYKTEQQQQHKRENFTPSQQFPANPQAAQLKYPDSGAVVVHNKSNNKISSPSAPAPAQSQESGSNSFDHHHQEANTYARSLGLNVQSITTAPLISSFTVQTPVKY